MLLNKCIRDRTHGRKIQHRLTNIFSIIYNSFVTLKAIPDTGAHWDPHSIGQEWRPTVTQQ